MPRMKTVRNALALAGIAFSCMGAALPTALAAHVPHRIVSLNLCSDQYLLALADPDQIAGLTYYADKPEMSAAADKARGLPVLGHSAEEVLDIAPDLLVGMPARRSAVVAALKEQHYATLDVARARSFEDIVAETRKIAHAIGHRARGDALIARMERALAELPRPGHGRVAAYYQRRGFLTGTGTLVDDLMKRAGLVNLAQKLHKPALSQISLEKLIAARPDFIILDSASRHVTDEGTAMLNHPALRHIPRIYLPQAWTVCGGPAYIKAERSLVRQLEAY